MKNPLNGLLALLSAEPVQAQAMVQTGVALGCAFGLHMTPEQIGATIAFTASALAFFTRRAVTANVNLPPTP